MESALMELGNVPYTRKSLLSYFRRLVLLQLALLQSTSNSDCVIWAGTPKELTPCQQEELPFH